MEMVNLQLKRNVYIIPLLTVLSLIGVIVTLVSTKWGVGLSPDSVAYVKAARELVSRPGIDVILGKDAVEPWGHFPPLFPALLAFIGFFGIDPLIWARWLNALLFGANIMLMGLVISRYTYGSVWASAIGSFFMLSSPVMLSVHTMAWTEPTFIFFGLLGLFLLSMHIENSDFKILILSASLIALAFLTRYVGCSLVATGMIGIILLSSGTYSKRIINSIVFVVISIFPILLWFIRNFYLAGTIHDREIVFHPITAIKIMGGLNTVSRWFLPPRIPNNIRLFTFIVIAAIFLIINKLTLNKELRQQRLDYKNNSIKQFLYLLIICIFVYIGFLIVSISFYDAHIYLNNRILSFVFVLGLVLIVCQTSRLLRVPKILPIYQVTSILICIGIAGFYMHQSMFDIIKSNRYGRGYALKTWKQSEITQQVPPFPAWVKVYSNGPDYFYILTGKYANTIPLKVNPSTRLRNNKYRSQLSSMRRQGGFLVYYNRISRWYLPSEKELKEALPLKLLISRADGSIYVITK